MRRLSAPSRWAQLDTGIAKLRTCVADEVGAWTLNQLNSIVEHHRSTDGPYRDLLHSSGIADDWPLMSISDMERLPMTDKEFLRENSFPTAIRSVEPVVVVSTSGTTSSAAPVPHTRSSLDAGLGDNFGRALLIGGAGLPAKPWLVGHWDADATDRSVSLTGSYLSMAWLDQILEGNTLLRNGLENPCKLVEEAAAYRPGFVASSPNLLANLAREAEATGITFDTKTLLYGGAAASSSHRSRWSRVFNPERVIAFYPTTDAGAIGVSAMDNGVYETFTETHFVEILNEQGVHVDIGERGQVAVTAFRSRAAPLIRYCVGDAATYEGVKNNRVVISSIERSSDAAVGDTLVPLEVISGWAQCLRSQGFGVDAAQLACRTDSGGRDIPVVRLFGADHSQALEDSALSLLWDLPQLCHEMDEGSISAPRVEYLRSSGLRGRFKVAPFVNERMKQPNRGVQTR